MKRALRTSNSEATEAIGHDIGETIEPPMVLALTGPLGAGKTTFVRGIARGLGIERVKSPSFTLINLYKGRCPLYHVDLYRLETGEELVPLGLLEVLENEGAVVAIEWSDRCEALLPDDRLDIRIGHASETEREITLEARGPLSRELLSRLGFDNEVEKK
jgi:tRNA threonylcarbamoyladenosine biosynthesis protein TsaE